MKTRLSLIFMALLCSFLASAQNLTVDITFTATLDGSYVQLDSVKAINKSTGERTVVYGPDTSMILNITSGGGDLLLYVGYITVNSSGVQPYLENENYFWLSEHYPNPVKEQTFFSLNAPENGHVSFTLTKIDGQVLLKKDQQIGKGKNSFRLIPGGKGTYFLSAQWNGISRVLKVVSVTANSYNQCSLDYFGTQNTDMSHKSHSAYLNKGNMLESGILDTTLVSKTINFEFAANIPCPGVPTVNYEGQDYATVQIRSQCWMKENLNAGVMIPGTQLMNDPYVLEKYCYADSEDSCTKYGGLYSWNEIMQLSTQQGARGICPPGWHIPTDGEWKVLEQAVDSQYGIGDEEWEIPLWYHGFDAGMNLRSGQYWYNPGNGPDAFGFTALPGGYRSNPSGTFFSITTHACFWTSTAGGFNDGIPHFIEYNDPRINNSLYNKRSGLSLRCIKNY